MTSGKALRLRRILSDRGRALVVPMDHGISVGPVRGLTDIRTMVDKVSAGGADGVVLHKGLVPTVQRALRPATGLIVHMSASTDLGPHSSRKVTVCTVAEAVRLGADAVSVHLNAGVDTEPEQIAATAAVAEDCATWGMPLMVMVYVRDTIESEFDPRKLAHAARLAAELGADLVKCHYTGDPVTFADVVAGCPVPVLIAGGASHGDPRALFRIVGEALEGGAAGISIGRNIFESADPQALTRRLARMIHEGAGADEAYEDYLDHLAGVSRPAPQLSLTTTGRQS